MTEGEDEAELPIGDKYFSFMPGIGTTNAIFAVRPLMYNIGDCIRYLKSYNIRMIE